MKSPLVSIIIVNWNGGDLLDNCLNSLAKMNYKNWELIIIDNGSDIKPRVKIKNSRIIFNKDNRGFAPANNQGLKIAKGKYVLLLNNDTVVSVNLLKAMVDKMESDETIGAMQPKIKLLDDPKYLDNAGSFLTRTGFLVHWGFGKTDGKDFDTEKEIFSAKGACLLTRKTLTDKVGLFDDDFVSYFEESDFCWRVWLSGMRVIYFPKTYILHKVGFTNKKLDVIEINYNSIKNRIASLFKNLNTGNIILVFLPHLVIMFGLMFYYLIRLQFNKFMMIYRAITWNLKNFHTLVIKRNKVQTIRKVSDNEIFKRVGRKFDIIEMLGHFRKVEANFQK